MKMPRLWINAVSSDLSLPDLISAFQPACSSAPHSTANTIGRQRHDRALGMRSAVAAECLRMREGGHRSACRRQVRDGKASLRMYSRRGRSMRPESKRSRLRIGCSRRAFLRRFQLQEPFMQSSTHRIASVTLAVVHGGRRSSAIGAGHGRRRADATRPRTSSTTRSTRRTTPRWWRGEGGRAGRARSRARDRSRCSRRPTRPSRRCPMARSTCC